MKSQLLGQSPAALAVGGYSLFLAGEFVCLHSPTLFSRFGLSSERPWALYLLALMGLQVLVMALAAVLLGRKKTWPSRGSVLLAAALSGLALLAVFMLVAGDAAADTAGLPLLLASGLLYGAGSGLFTLAWARVFSALPARQLYQQVICAYLL